MHVEFKNNSWNNTFQPHRVLHPILAKLSKYASIKLYFNSGLFIQQQMLINFNFNKLVYSCKYFFNYIKTEKISNTLKFNDFYATDAIFCIKSHVRFSKFSGGDTPGHPFGDVTQSRAPSPPKSWLRAW